MGGGGRTRKGSSGRHRTGMSLKAVGVPCPLPKNLAQRMNGRDGRFLRRMTFGEPESDVLQAWDCGGSRR